MAHLTIAAVIESTVLGYGGQGATGALMKSLVAKRSIVIDGHKTSVSLEDAFWRDLKNIAHTQQASLGELVARIDQTRDRGNLSSAIRLFVLEHFQKSGSTQSGHAAVSAEGTRVAES